MPKSPDGMAYTRREYVHSVPPNKVTRFTIGESSPDYEYTVALVTSNDIEITGSALEAARVTANKVLTIATGGKSYFLRICSYPHEIVREHKFMGFAGADRLSQGMKNAFGRPTGRSARLSANQKVIAVDVNKDKIDLAKEALKRASKKLPLSYRVVVEEIKQTKKEPT
jgi:large subunit ribosomal protein L10e